MLLVALLDISSYFQHRPCIPQCSSDFRRGTLPTLYVSIFQHSLKRGVGGCWRDMLELFLCRHEFAQDSFEFTVSYERTRLLRLVNSYWFLRVLGWFEWYT